MLMQFIKLWWKPFSLVIIWWEYVIDVSFTRCCYLYLIVPTYARLLGVLEHPELGWPKHQPVIMVQLNLHIGKRDSQAIICKITLKCLFPLQIDSSRWTKYLTIICTSLNVLDYTCRLALPPLILVNRWQGACSPSPRVWWRPYPSSCPASRRREPRAPCTQSTLVRHSQLQSASVNSSQLQFASVSSSQLQSALVSYSQHPSTPVSSSHL